MSISASALAIAAAPAESQELPEILDQSESSEAPYLPDFSYAGYEYGLEPVPEVSQIILAADHGAVPDDGRDDSAALIAAIAAASATNGPVKVQLAAGRYELTEILWIEGSNIVLAGVGSGEGGTELYMPRPLNQMDDGGASDELRKYLVENDKRERQPDKNLDVLFSEYSWNGGFIWTRAPGGRHATYMEEYDRDIVGLGDISVGVKGTRQVSIGAKSDLKVGDVVQIHWHNRAGENGPLIAEMYGDTDEKIGDRHWTLPDRPLVRQATRIEAINGNQVTIADPLLHNISGDLPAYFAKWDHLSGVGLQDFAMTFPENPFFGHHNESGFNGIYFTGVHNGWITNVTVTNADAGIMTDDLANVTISNIKTDGNHIAHYSVHVGNVHNVLVEGVNVFNPTIHTFSFNTQATKSVYRNSVGWVAPTLDQHAGANHQNLYDNVTVHITPDQKAADGSAMYDLYKAGGAGYWLPGHGRYNTMWNVKVLVDGSVPPDEKVTILGASEGPEARIIGMHGNREIVLDYRPQPYVELMNTPIDTIPSLYAWQLAQRR
ncbi:hypothetical protein [Altererythrobacter sp. ZODW24]|uniref:hypothetical protein n=1 Tax=Altererythrobacter sp. ZODW24 TaxID=2185142 RepID=UPI000DF827A2|nr:hypothetical protein [Altererythrobacter sp. ZODW24]